MENSKIKLVVINENTLGYLIPNTDLAGVLRASRLKGSNFNEMDNAFVKGAKIRMASAKDFAAYRVDFTGYDNTEEYEFSKI